MEEDPSVPPRRLRRWLRRWLRRRLFTHDVSRSLHGPAAPEPSETARVLPRVSTQPRRFVLHARSTAPDQSGRASRDSAGHWDRRFKVPTGPRKPAHSHRMVTAARVQSRAVYPACDGVAGGEPGALLLRGHAGSPLVQWRDGARLDARVGRESSDVPQLSLELNAFRLEHHPKQLECWTHCILAAQ